MAKVHITNVVVLDNPSSFFNPFQFELTFECIEELKEDLEWKMIYVGSAESEEYDQILDTIYVGPVPEGRHIFVFQADAPDVTKIPEQDVVGVTIILLTCSYRGQEFVRVGYFINNDYADAELRENPPPKPLYEKLTRNILASKPRVTRFKINWDDTPSSSSGGAVPGSIGNGAELAPMQAISDDDEDGVNSANMAVANRMKQNMMGEGGNGYDMAMAANTSLAMVAATSSTSSTHKIEPATMEDDDSLAMPIRNGVVGINENSNSLAMEC